MNTEYSKDMIAFAEDVSDMMAKRRKLDEIKKALHISPIHRKYDGEDLASAAYELRVAECEVREWLRDIFGEEEWL
jgi:hypothetical protein